MRARGTIEHSGSTYKLYESIRIGLPFPDVPGTQTYKQYWAIRSEKRTSGTVDTRIIFDAWAAAGMQLGKHDMQIVATEGYFSKGQSKVSIETPP